LESVTIGSTSVAALFEGSVFLERKRLVELLDEWLKLGLGGTLLLCGLDALEGFDDVGSSCGYVAGLSVNTGSVD